MNQGILGMDYGSTLNNNINIYSLEERMNIGNLIQVFKFIKSEILRDWVWIFIRIQNKRT